MSDFKYDSYDVSSMKVAFQHLRQVQRKGFYYGVLFGIPMGLVFNKSLQSQLRFQVPTVYSVAIPLIAGSLIYGAYTWNARSQYASTASKVNRKYSKIINKIINY